MKYFYVQLNENNIKTYIISSPRNINISKILLITDYKETDI